jgi:hypothetical protein
MTPFSMIARKETNKKYQKQVHLPPELCGRQVFIFIAKSAA